MKGLSDWIKTWSVPQAIVAGVALCCTTALAIAITVQDDWGKLTHWLTQPEAIGLLTSLATLLGVLYHRALGLPADSQQATPPRDREGGFADWRVMAFVVLAALFGLAGCALLAGCSPSALQVHATIASLAGDVIDEGCAAVEHERDVEQHEAVEQYATRELAAAAVASVRLRWDVFISACNLAVDAQNAWAVGLGLLATSGRWDLRRSLALAVPLVRIWDDFVALRPPLPEGVTLPSIPAELLTLIATPIEVQ